MTFKPIETQEDFDAAVKERIERAKRSAAERYSVELQILLAPRLRAN